MLVGMVIGGFLLHEGKSIEGFTALFGPLGGVAGLFLFTRWRDIQKQARKHATESQPLERT